MAAAGMSAGLLCVAYFFDPISAGSLKDVLILVSGGLLALAGAMATDNPPNYVQALLDHEYRMSQPPEAPASLE